MKVLEKRDEPCSRNGEILYRLPDARGSSYTDEKLNMDLKNGELDFSEGFFLLRLRHRTILESRNWFMVSIHCI